MEFNDLKNFKRKFFFAKKLKRFENLKIETLKDS